MVPVADMINHQMDDKGGAKTTKDGASFAIFAGQNYDPGDEVFTSYSDECNLYYLMTYGFEIPGNTHNCTRIPSQRDDWSKIEKEVHWKWATAGLGASESKDVSKSV
mmetsp:Transcript_7289/g.11476  ORF Transcript_7289/g.11476 Transcript_7289/m.11476 type:complete len:107 (-) Transcript_7289:265-585(-)|eukprot:CAMPEP_0184294008 /NCGR_PEP_ID=MMETSP1049-20130417/5295_1 /TAXON_ID=77928 /ORGANISM="Proteomonas sulcata, Strain CCMP704" /LENGTH=106 /DNA_ID=CAMNT_0026602145 /DNA_START=120 /DNA_END=440 /DNA_ORIENTATION=-